MKISKQENMDVVKIMNLLSQKEDICPGVADTLRRGADLLKRTTMFCDVLIAILDTEVPEETVETMFADSVSELSEAVKTLQNVFEEVKKHGNLV